MCVCVLKAMTNKQLAVILRVVLLVQAGGVVLSASDQGRTLKLSIRSVSPSDAGTYTCKARNRLGHAEQTSSLIVQCTTQL